MASEIQKRATKKYNQTEKGKARKARHDQTGKGKATKARANVRYNQTEKGKATQVRYRQSEKGKITQARGDVRYQQTEKGKTTDARVKAKRERDLGYKPINEWFIGCNGHHINKNDVLFIPEKLHKAISHSQDDSESMRAINKVAFKWFYNV